MTSTGYQTGWPAPVEAGAEHRQEQRSRIAMRLYGFLGFLTLWNVVSRPQFTALTCVSWSKDVQITHSGSAVRNSPAPGNDCLFIGRILAHDAADGKRHNRKVGSIVLPRNAADIECRGSKRLQNIAVSDKHYLVCWRCGTSKNWYQSTRT